MSFPHVYLVPLGTVAPSPGPWAVVKLTVIVLSISTLDFLHYHCLNPLYSILLFITQIISLDQVITNI